MNKGEVGKWQTQALATLPYVATNPTPFLGTPCATRIVQMALVA